jgi:phage replication O-like protein O
MVSPQTEDGYTRIANQIMDNLPRFKLNGTQLRILLVILRQTYGFRRKEHALSITFIAGAMDASKSQVDRELTALIERNIVQVVSGGGRSTRVLRFNKDYSSWINERCTRNGGQEQSTLQNEDSLSAKIGTDLPSKTRTKERKKENSKENTSSPRNKKPTYSEDSRYFQMAVYFHNKIMEHAAKNSVDHLVKNAPMQKWADVFRKIVELDKRDTKELKQIIDWCTADTFWQTNILSPANLREKYVQLVMKMKTGTGQGKPDAQSRFQKNKQFLQQKMSEVNDSEQEGGFETPSPDLFGLPDGGADG